MLPPNAFRARFKCKSTPSVSLPCAAIHASSICSLTSDADGIPPPIALVAFVAVVALPAVALALPPPVVAAVVVALVVAFWPPPPVVVGAQADCALPPPVVGGVVVVALPVMF